MQIINVTVIYIVTLCSHTFEREQDVPAIAFPPLVPWGLFLCSGVTDFPQPLCEDRWSLPTGTRVCGVARSPDEGGRGRDLAHGAQTPFCSCPQSHPLLPTVVDGVLLPKQPEEILAEKKFNTVPYIVGINKQEFGWVLPLVRMCGPLRRAPRPSHHPATSGPRSSSSSRPPSGSRAAVPFACPWGPSLGWHDCHLGGNWEPLPQTLCLQSENPEMYLGRVDKAQRSLLCR